MSDALYIDDLQVGMQWESARRAVTEAEIISFAGVSGDVNPLHTDELTATESGPGAGMTDAAIITGAAGALGRAIAQRVAEDVDAVLLVDLASEGLTAAIGTLGRESEAAGGAVARDLTAADAPSVVVAADLVAPARLAMALAPLMLTGSAVVNIASRAALGSFGPANYAAAKAGLIALTRALALQWAPHIRVNAVAPGLVDTPMTAGMPEKVLSSMMKRIPTGRMARPEEIAEAVAFCGSAAASYITGQLIVACGGRSIAA